MTHPNWVQPIAETIRNNESRGGFLVVFPEYRPDQFVALARHLGLASFDYRSEVMSPLGWDADQLSLDDLDATLHDRASEGGTVVNNVEALLSTKGIEECETWMGEFLRKDWAHALLVTIVVNAAQTPMTHGRVHRIPGEALAEQSFINRLVF
ncbi:MAG: hypothetical protein U9P00_07935 [Pseudomonadota bacterium]|nr:hypothetical protein [Pseudomonadota bacterium]